MDSAKEKNSSENNQWSETKRKSEMEISEAQLKTIEENAFVNALAVQNHLKSSYSKQLLVRRGEIPPRGGKLAQMPRPGILSRGCV